MHNPTQWKFIDHAAHLATTAGLGISLAQLGLVNGTFDGDFEATLTSMLDGTWAFADGTPLTGLGRDLAVTYGVRNRGAHDVTATKTVGSRFDEVRQFVFSTLFLLRRDVLLTHAAPQAPCIATSNAQAPPHGRWGRVYPACDSAVFSARSVVGARLSSMLEGVVTQRAIERSWRERCRTGIPVGCRSVA